jgi:hypothetical protein
MARRALPLEEKRSEGLQLRLTPGQMAALQRLRDAEALTRGRDVALSELALDLIVEHPRFVLAAGGGR